MAFNRSEHEAKVAEFFASKKKKQALRAGGRTFKTPGATWSVDNPDVVDKYEVKPAGGWSKASGEGWSKASELRLLERRRVEKEAAEAEARKWNAIHLHQEARQRNREIERKLEEAKRPECERLAAELLAGKGFEPTEIQKKIVAEIAYMAFYETHGPTKLRAAEGLANIDGRLGLKPRAAEPIKDDGEEETHLSTKDMVAQMLGDPEFRAELARQQAVEDGDGKEDTE